MAEPNRHQLLVYVVVAEINYRNPVVRSTVRIVNARRIRLPGHNKYLANTNPVDAAISRHVAIGPGPDFEPIPAAGAVERTPKGFVSTD